MAEKDQEINETTPEETSEVEETNLEETSSEEEVSEETSEEVEASDAEEVAEESDASEEEEEAGDEDVEDDTPEAGEEAEVSEAEEASEEEEASVEEEVEELEEDLEEDSEPVSVSEDIDGLAAYFDYPEELLVAAAQMRDAKEPWEKWDAYSPFPIHGIEDAMGIGRSWLPWVTFGAGGTGFLIANMLQFGTLSFDWPMVIGGKPHAPWPSFVPVMFELTVLIGGVTTALVMLIASGCFRKPKIIDRGITTDRFLIWIASDDPNFAQAREFLQGLDPVEIREITYE